MFYQNFFDFFFNFDGKPSEAILAADAAGILPPELTALKGRIQPPQYHPEGDAFVHTLLVVDRAFELDGSVFDLWGALVHDLGKAVTPTDNLPHHYNHEALGVPLVKQLGDRLEVCDAITAFGQLCAGEHLNVHKFLDLRPVKKVDFLTRVHEFGVAHNNFEDAQADYPIIINLALVAQADAQGRGPTLVDKPYPQRQAVIDAWNIIKDIHDENPENQRRLRAKAIAGKFGK
jgi:tRNA nucleotidyltransferase (CCA-adding enzyme)